MVCGTIRSSRSTPHSASNNPNTPPIAPSTALSVRNCRASLQRPAPSAMRMAVSRVRPAARASIRFARFAHAISSTSATAASSSNRSAAHVFRQHIREQQPRWWPKPSAQSHLSPIRCSIAFSSALACCHRYPRLQMTEHTETMLSTGCDAEGPSPPTAPDISPGSGNQKFARQNADHRVGKVIHQHFLPHHVRIFSVIALPHAVAR